MAFPSQSFQFNQAAPVLQATTPFILNSNTVMSSYVIPQGYNCISSGPITVSTSAVVTVPTGSRWVIV
jgi:hypothetical protein